VTFDLAALGPFLITVVMVDIDQPNTGCEPVYDQPDVGAHPH
jgi:hypothetical protein